LGINTPFCENFCFQADSYVLISLLTGITYISLQRGVIAFARFLQTIATDRTTFCFTYKYFNTSGYLEPSLGADNNFNLKSFIVSVDENQDKKKEMTCQKKLQDLNGLFPV